MKHTSRQELVAGRVVSPYCSPMDKRRFLSARPLLLAGALGLLLPSGESLFPAPVAARAGREVFRTLVGASEARVLVTFRPAELTGGPGSGRTAQPGRLIDDVLEGILPRDLREEGRLKSVPVLMARITRRGLFRLMADPRVSRIDLDGKVHGTDASSNAQIGADRVQAFGISGQGVTVAVLDSGTDPASNPDLDSSLVAEECFCSGGGGCCPNHSFRQSGPGSAASLASHGPGLIQILTSDGLVGPAGVAPGAGFLAIRVLDDSLVGTRSDIVKALDWVVANRPDVRLVNLSLEADIFPADCDHLDAFSEAVSQLSSLFRARGGLFFAASGNDGSTFKIGSPACVTSVVAVGAVGGLDQFILLSNANPSLDLLAPGLNIQTRGSFGQITVFTGTSAATPHAVGVAALMLSADPSLSAQEVEDRLKRGGLPVADPRTGIFYPRVDALRSVAIPVELGLEPPILSPRSRGRGFSARVEPRPPFRAADLDVDSLILSIAGGTGVKAEVNGAELGDGDEDGIPDLTVHFDRRLLLSGVTAPGTQPVVLGGALLSGLACRGRADLRVLPATGAGNASEPTP